MSPRRYPVAIVATLALLAGACGGGSDRATGSEPATTEVATPRRIVSLSPTATEMLFAIGAGPQVVAVDDQSNDPAEAPRTDLSGYKPNVEAIAGRQPDLVVISESAGT